MPQVTQYQIATAETTVFDVKTHRIVWSTTSQTFNPTSVQQEAYISNALLQVADAIGALTTIDDILQTLVQVTPLHVTLTVGQDGDEVQLPLALPTVMAGVNQVIMLGLSMAAIAGMVGTGGLGGDVNQAIGQLNVGLGSEAGVAIVRPGSPKFTLLNRL